MALIEHTLYGRIDKVQKAIDRIKLFDPSGSEAMQDLAPYYVAYSGGKDSDCIRILCKLAGVKYDLVHNLTTVDAPETVRYVQSIGARIDRPSISMWKLIVEKGFPPIRTKRYCCEYLKERGGRNRVVMTGVRWAESPGRKAKRGIAEVQSGNIKNKRILNADNDEHRRVFEHCQIKGKRVVNPIVDWQNEDVKEFLDHHNCQSNPLYQCGFRRIGCIGCPNAGKVGREIEFMRWPIYKENYIRTFQKMIDVHGYADTSENWTSGEAVFDWWMQEKNMKKEIEGQIDMFEEI